LIARVVSYVSAIAASLRRPAALAAHHWQTAGITIAMEIGTMENQDKPLSDDLAEIKREVQVEIDTNVDLRGKLAQSNARLASYATQIGATADDAKKQVGDYLGQYLNPTQPNPTEPLDAEVAAPPRAEEPPVFTDVSSTDLSGGSTSGGSAVVGDGFALPEPAEG
jgi:hypothetical protein